MPPANISLLAEEKSVNLSWEARRRHRNIGFQIHYLNKNGTKSTFPQSFNSIVWVVCLQRIRRLVLFVYSCRWQPVEEVGEGELFPAVLPAPGPDPRQPIPPALHLQKQHFLGDWDPDKRNKYYKRSSASIPLSFHLSLLPPLGFPLLNIKLDPAESIFQLSPQPVKCFQRLALAESWVSRTKWSFTCVWHIVLSPW